MATGKKIPTIESKALSIAIKRAMATRELKVKSLAEKSGVPYGTLRRILELNTVADYEQLQRISTALRTPLAQIIADAGCRIGESLALKVGDVDADRRRARIGRTWTDDGHGGSMLGTPKNGKARNIAIPRFLMPQIKAQMDGMGDDDWLFRATRGGNVWTNTWRTRIWNKAVKAAGMEDAGVTIHSLRHTYASFAIAQGADVKTLQMQLGHSSPSITLNTYTALWPERLDDVADAIGALRERELV